jgi:uncharacterized protein (TIGR03086 family)
MMDPAHEREWMTALSEVNVLSPPPLGVGSRVERVAHFLGKRMAYVNEITEFSPPSRLAMRSVDGPFPMTVVYEFEPVERGTRVTIDTRGDAGGFYKLAAPLLSFQVRRAVTADLARVKQHLESQGGDTMDPVSRLQAVVDDALAMVGNVKAGQLGAQTPCSEWDTAALMNHMIGVVNMFAVAVRGGTPDMSMDAAGTADHRAAYAAGSADMMAAFREPGALDRTVQMPFGPIPATMALSIVTIDQLIHVWDLAKAIGSEKDLDAEASTAAFEGLKGILSPDFRGPGKPFAAEIPWPDDAPIQERLLAYSGRKPN